MIPIPIILSILAAITIAATTTIITTSYIKKFRTKKTTKIVLTNINELIKEASKSGNNTLKISDLEKMKENPIFMAEYDDEKDEILKSTLAKDLEPNLSKLLKKSNNTIILTD